MFNLYDHHQALKFLLCGNCCIIRSYTLHSSVYVLVYPLVMGLCFCDSYDNNFNT
jgi:hypothetical protein